MIISGNPITSAPLCADATPVLPAALQDPLGYTNDRAELPPHPNYLICDRTGFKIRVSDGLRKEWTGALVREESWEPRHQQDFVRAVPEHQKGSPRPEQQDTFATPPAKRIPPEAPFLNLEMVDDDIFLYWTPSRYTWPNVVTSYEVWQSFNNGPYELIATKIVGVDGRTHTIEDPAIGYYQFYVIAKTS